MPGVLAWSGEMQAGGGELVAQVGSGCHAHWLPPLVRARVSSVSGVLLQTAFPQTRSAATPALPRDCQDLLRQTAVLKLNGGLGTSMGLEKAKSLLEVRSCLSMYCYCLLCELGALQKAKLLLGCTPAVHAVIAPLHRSAGIAPTCLLSCQLPKQVLIAAAFESTGLQVKNGKTFLDLIAEQVKHTRQKFGALAASAAAAASAC